jgi:hypothetical protein
MRGPFNNAVMCVVHVDILHVNDRKALLSATYIYLETPKLGSAKSTLVEMTDAG